MRRIWPEFRASISPSACVLAAFMLLLLPIKWIFAALVAAAFHEGCHILAVWLCGGNIATLSIGDRGAVLQAGSLSAGKSIICSLAGPLGSLFLLLFLRFIPRIALCALVQGIYNLLPIYPLDGGRVLQTLMDMKNRP